jgi:multiple antibiotic resistance protein
MADHWSEYTRFGVGLFALLDPFTLLPYVLAVSSRSGERAVLAMAAAATATATLVLLVMHFAGEAVLAMLGTSLPSFQIGGGLMILLSGLALLGDQDQPAGGPAPAAADGRADDLARSVRLGVAPLGIPMLAGAGAITKVVIKTQPGYGVDADVHIAGIIVGVCLLAGAVTASSSVLTRSLGPSFLSVLSRVAGLVIVAVGVELMVQGVSAHARRLVGG